jgi:hypothetical protein
MWLLNDFVYDNKAEQLTDYPIAFGSDLHKNISRIADMFMTYVGYSRHDELVIWSRGIF